MVDFALIGGFLGAGKTSLMCRIGQDLSAAGRRVALITNDQAADLVDSEYARRLGLPVSEIAGGCFCCRFQDLVKAYDEILAAVAPEVVLAEPVGSCADLNATVMQPLKRFYGDRLRPLAYSVLVDPERTAELLDEPGASTPLGYLYGQQIAEADLLVLTKGDRLSAEARDGLLTRLSRRLPATPALWLSAHSGVGVDEWWRRVGALPGVGQRLLDIDYDTYAEAEAALGWLNATVSLRAERPFATGELLAELLRDLRHGAARALAAIGHLKALLTTAERSLRGNVTGSQTPVELTGEGWPTTAAELTLNARIELAPDELEALVRRALRRVGNQFGAAPTVLRLECFRPGRPQPTWRFDEAI
jgi:Ni2+-binding GTPase involved in maturation of urease and hydrogenase